MATHAARISYRRFICPELREEEEEATMMNELEDYKRILLLLTSTPSGV
jgi:hypothetical protein